PTDVPPNFITCNRAFISLHFKWQPLARARNAAIFSIVGFVYHAPGEIRGCPSSPSQAGPMRRFFWIRLTLFLRQSRWGFALLALWFALGTIAFRQWGHLPLRDAFLCAVYLRVHPGQLSELYSFWGQCVLFGIVISIFILQALQRYNPQEGSRMLA